MIGRDRPQIPIHGYGGNVSTSHVLMRMQVILSGAHVWLWAKNAGLVLQMVA